MKLILVRHGQSEGNVLKVLEGDGRLSELGVEQAGKVAEALKDEDVDFVYSSDMIRAKNTAGKICEKLGNDFVCDERLREMEFGDNEGMSYDEIKERKDEAGASETEFVLEGGETWEELSQRVNEFFYELLEKHEDKCVMIVAHGGVIISLLRHLNGELVDGLDGYMLENTGITYLDNEDGEWKITKLNSVEHLI